MSANSASIETAWRAAKAVSGPHSANRILQNHGGNAAQFDSVPSSRQAACIAALNALAEGDGDGRDKSKPETFEDLHDAAYAKWNAPPSVKRDE